MARESQPYPTFRRSNRRVLVTSLISVCVVIFVVLSIWDSVRSPMKKEKLSMIIPAMMIDPIISRWLLMIKMPLYMT